jgi:hypothetical protein
MCPLCIATGSLLFTGVGVGSAGGLTAVAAKLLRVRRPNRRRMPEEAQSLEHPASAATGADFPHPSSELASK